MLKIILISSLFIGAYAARQAVVVLQGTGIQGKVTFTETSDGVVVEGSISGLTKGLHGFHIHEKGDMSSGCTSAGPHFNPYKKNHGGPTDSDRHVGDLGNIEAGEDKVANVKIIDKQIALDGETCILGRGVVVHADADDLGKGGQSDSLTTGHAGARIACGVIGIVSGSNLVTISSFLFFMTISLSLIFK